MLSDYVTPKGCVHIMSKTVESFAALQIFTLKIYNLDHFHLKSLCFYWVSFNLEASVFVSVFVCV